MTAITHIPKFLQFNDKNQYSSYEKFQKPGMTIIRGVMHPLWHIPMANQYSNMGNRKIVTRDNYLFDSHGNQRDLGQQYEWSKGPAHINVEGGVVIRSEMQEKADKEIVAKFMDMMRAASQTSCPITPTKQVLSTKSLTPKKVVPYSSVIESSSDESVSPYENEDEDEELEDEEYIGGNDMKNVTPNKRFSKSISKGSSSKNIKLIKPKFKTSRHPNSASIKVRVERHKKRVQDIVGYPQVDGIFQVPDTRTDLQYWIQNQRSQQKRGKMLNQVINLAEAAGLHMKLGNSVNVKFVKVH